jgi:hypothetical protein
MCLANITADVHTPVVVAGGTDNWVPGTIEHLAAPLVGTGWSPPATSRIAWPDGRSLVPLRNPCLVATVTQRQAA